LSAVVVVPDMLVVVVVVVVATFTMRGTHTPAVRQQLPLELEEPKEQLPLQVVALVYMHWVARTLHLEQHSLRLVVVAAEAMKEAHKMGILVDLVAVVQTNPAQPILDLVVQELQDKDLLVVIHAAVAVVKSLAAAAAAQVVLALMELLVDVVVVVTDPTIRELEEMVFRTQ
jgi:hypothetical protein